MEVNEITEVIKNSNSISNVCNKIYGYNNGKNVKLIFEFIEKNNIDTSHFDKYLSKRKYEIIKKICPICNIEFETKKDFKDEKTTCSKSCSNKYFKNGINNPNFDITKKTEMYNKVTNSLLNHYNNDTNFNENNEYEYNCIKCDNFFVSKKIIRNDRKKHCDYCKLNRPHSIDPSSLFDLSVRTISKILKRAKIKCVMCSWDKTSLDIHHIIPKCDGGSDDDNNLICVCPNCHRLAHENKYTIEELKNNSIEIVFKNWKDYYHISN